MVDPERLLTVAEAGKMCPYSEPQLRAWIRDGRLPALKLAGNIFIETDAFKAFLLKHSA